jgi:hypothetical protein
MKKNALPKIGDALDASMKSVAAKIAVADKVVSAARELPPNNWTISCPVLIWDEGYARKSLDVRLTEVQANKLKAIQLGLESKDAKLENGRYVSNPVDAIRWMLENIS